MQSVIRNNKTFDPIVIKDSCPSLVGAKGIGSFALDLMQGQFSRVFIEYDVGDPFIANESAMGIDADIFAGLLGLNAQDLRLKSLPVNISKWLPFSSAYRTITR